MTIVHYCVVALLLGARQEAGASEIDATAKAVVERAGAASMAMKTFYMESQTTRTFGTGGQQMEQVQTKVWCTRPGRVLLTRQSGPIGVACYVNGKTLVAYNAPPRNDYNKREIKEPLPEELANIKLILPTPARLLFSDEPTKQVLDHLENLTYSGQQSVNGTPCYVVSSKSKLLDSHFYFDANGHLRRSTMMGRAGTPIAGAGEDTIYKFVPNQSIPDTTYTFTPPAGAKEQTVQSTP